VIRRSVLNHSIGGHAGGKAANVTRPSTARIRDGVMAEFHRIDLPTVCVDVVVADGVVHLWGFVESAVQRKAFALAARRVPGVKKVENHLAMFSISGYGSE